MGEALLVRGLSATAFGVLAGRTLEAVCADKRAPHRWLNDNLKWLATEGVIPQQLYEMARAVQQLRNIGAHFNVDRITQDDVPVVLEFVDAVLEYVYRAPAKIATVQTRLRRPGQ